jgi:glutamyl-tRNA synthetase
VILNVKAEAFWLAVRGNLDVFPDAARWWRIVSVGPETPPDLSEEDRDFVRGAYDSLPSKPWNRETWKTWTDEVKKATGRKGRALYHPLRLALTGLSAGPELSDLLPLIGREGALSRRP